MPTIEEILKREPALAVAGEGAGGTLLAGERTPTGQRREVFVRGTTPPTTTPTTPISQVAGLDIPTETGLDVFLREERERAGIERRRELDEEQVRKQATERIQKEIDAINQVFAERLSRARMREAGELGTATAIQARRGIAGSPFAEAQRTQIGETAEARERAIEAEKVLAVQSITDKANELAQEEITRRQEAIDRGSEEFLKFLGAEEQRKEQRLNTLAQTIIAKGLTADTLSQEDITGIEKAGFSLDDVRRAVAGLTEAEEVKTEIVESGGKKLLINSETGETIRDLGESTGEEKRQIIESGGRQLLIDSITGETIKDLGEVSTEKLLKEKKLRLDIAKLNEELTGIGGLSKEDKDFALKLNDRFEKASGDFFGVRDSFNRVISSAKDPSAAGDLALIFNYMKMLDPGSVVREGEFATAQNSAGIPDRIRAKYNQALRGERLAENTREDFLDRAKRLFDSAKNQQQVIVDEFKQRTSEIGLPKEAEKLVIRNIDSVLEEEIETTEENEELKRKIIDAGKTEEEINEALNQGFTLPEIFQFIK